MQISVPLYNLVSFLNMNSYYLKKSENQYELKIRGQSTDGTADELRRRLSKCFKTNTPVDDTVVATLVVEEELTECETKFRDLSKLTRDYDGDYSDPEAQRIQARVFHYYTRVERIPVSEGEDDDAQLRDKLLGDLKALLDRFDSAKRTDQAGGRNAPPGPSAIPTTTAVDPRAAITLTTQVASPDVVVGPAAPIAPVAAPQVTQPSWHSSPTNEQSSCTRAVPVYKWGLTFDGQTQSVGAFLQRVEELRRARGVTPAELFNSAVDLFTGPALVWYRSTLGRIRTWDQLCKDLEVVFKPPDHDILLTREIFNRVQGPTEPIDLYIAAMEGLYGRLASDVPEETRLKQIYHNLSPQLQDRLALFDVESIEQLRQLGRKAEAGRYRSDATRGTRREHDVMEPDLAYTPVHLRQGSGARDPPARKVFQTVRDSEITCYRCHSKGHLSRECTTPSPSPATNIVCWRCNKTGHIQRFCRVRPNNLGRTSGNGEGPSGVAAAGPRQ